MREKFKKNKRYFAVLGLWILVGLAFWGSNKTVVWATEHNFVIDASMLPSNEETYDVQLSIENLGKNWEGTVRLIVEEDYLKPGAYDTVISLPQGIEKQFVVKVPINSLRDGDGTITVSLWNKDSEKVAEERFVRFLFDGADALGMGILSDNYSSLTFLDMGGEELYFYGNEYPIKLMELTQDSMVDNLENIEFLVIDTYNTTGFSDEEVQAIQDWVYNGGVLIVGTGNYAKDTLEGLGDSYLEVTCDHIFEPGEVNTYYQSEYADWTKVHYANLLDTYGKYYQQYVSGAYVSSEGDGAVGILPYSLTELAEVDDSFYLWVDQLDFVMSIMEEISSQANSRYDSSLHYSYQDNADTISRMLRMMGNADNTLHFGMLKVIVVLYVIFVGPVLYLILRMVKKRDLYWVAVPVASLIGIMLVFFAGRGFEVVDTRVYSVTTEKLSGNGKTETYFYCYDAKHKEWDLQLVEGYEYAGSLINDSYYYEDDGAYYHHIQKEGDTLSMGINPTSNFEDSYFMAGKAKGNHSTGGDIVLENVLSDWTGLNGTITNETDKDFQYYAVIANDTLYVFEDLPAGESRNLAKEMPVYNSMQNFSIWSHYLYDFLYELNEDGEKENVSLASALGVGLSVAYPQPDVNEIVVVGVVEEWDNAVDDNCKEISYGCLYTVQ